MTEILGYMQGVWSGTAARTQEDTFASVVGGTEILSMDTHIQRTAWQSVYEMGPVGNCLSLSASCGCDKD